MKKVGLTSIVLLLYIFSMTPAANANMAELTEREDIGSSITFEQNDTISVLSEILDITVHGSTADIVATYTMKNTTAETISTQAMFLSPNMENGGVQVLVNDRDSAFTVKSYALSYDTKIETEDWQYAVLSDEMLANDFSGQTVDAISFEMAFEGNEEYDVRVSYVYRLGGYPDYTFDAKEGRISYYLTPAALWKEFENLTINLYLDKDMPVIKSSNLDFEKIATRTYQYQSGTLPEENLHIVIDENQFQNFFSTLRSPYFAGILICLLLILIALGVAIFVVVRSRKRKKRGKQ